MLSFLPTLRQLVSLYRLLVVIAAMQKHGAFVRGIFFQQQPLQHLFVRSLPPEIILVNPELQGHRSNRRTRRKTVPFHQEVF